MAADEAADHPHIAQALHAESRQLKGGDYTWQTHWQLWVGVERKAPEDLIGSLLSNRLSSQLRELVGCCDIPYVLIEGWLRETPDGRIRTPAREWPLSWTYLQNYLAEVQEAGARLLHSPSIGATPKVLLGLYEWWQRPEHQALRQVKEADLRPYPRPVRRLASFSNYGPERAHGLLSHFGTLRAVFQATAGERMRVPGIGQVLAQGLDQELDEVYR